MYTSALIAFVGGLISLISPCSIMVIPTFIAALHSSKYSKYKVVWLFAVGIWTSLIPLAFGALAINRVYSLYREPVTKVAGIVLMGLAIALLFDKRIVFPNITNGLSKLSRASGAGKLLILGVIAGIGATTCIGPILGAILTLASTKTSILDTAILLSMYAAGIMVPIVIGSVMLGDRLTIKITTIRNIKIFTPIGSLSLYNLLTALIVFFVGFVFFRFQGSISFANIKWLQKLMNVGFEVQNTLVQP